MRVLGSLVELPIPPLRLTLSSTPRVPGSMVQLRVPSSDLISLLFMEYSAAGTIASPPFSVIVLYSFSILQYSYSTRSPSHM